MDTLERLFALEQFGIKLGLQGIGTLTGALGHPERRWPSLHVAGTNGKGSVTAMCEAALRAAGRRTGWYTSPHLAHLEERFRIDGQEVASAEMTATLAEIFAVIDRLLADGTLTATPTFFEVTTALAFELFARARVEVGIIEVGLGGRHDATNVLRPTVGAITSIQFDHERHLGTTLEAIAREKAGIAKRNVPLVIGPVSPAPHRVIRESAALAGAHVHDTQVETRRLVHLDRGHAVIDLETPVRRYRDVRLSLAGAHQAANAVVAVRTLELLAEAGMVGLDATAITAGLTSAVWPARLEWLRASGHPAVLLDAAHNPAGAEALAAYLAAAVTAPVTLVISVMQDKDAARLLDALLPHVSRVVATEARTARAMPAADLAALAGRRSGRGLPVEVCADPLEAVQRAGDGGHTPVVAGSIFLVGPLRAHLVTQGYAPADS